MSCIEHNNYTFKSQSEKFHNNIILLCSANIYMTSADDQRRCLYSSIIIA